MLTKVDLPGTGHPRHNSELAETEGGVEPVDAARVDIAEFQLAAGRARLGVGVERAMCQRPHGRRGAVSRKGAVSRGGGVSRGGSVRRLHGSGVENLAAALTGEGADIDKPVGFGNQVHVVLDQQHGVAGVDEAAADVQNRAALGRVEARGGLVQHIGNAEEPGAQLGRQAQALQLTAG